MHIKKSQLIKLALFSHFVLSLLRMIIDFLKPFFTISIDDVETTLS